MRVEFSTQGSVRVRDATNLGLEFIGAQRDCRRPGWASSPRRCLRPPAEEEATRAVEAVNDVWAERLSA